MSQERGTGIKVWFVGTLKRKKRRGREEEKGVKDDEREDKEEEEEERYLEIAMNWRWRERESCRTEELCIQCSRSRCIMKINK